MSLGPRKRPMAAKRETSLAEPLPDPENGAQLRARIEAQRQSGGAGAVYLTKGEREVLKIHEQQREAEEQTRRRREEDERHRAAEQRRIELRQEREAEAERAAAAQRAEQRTEGHRGGRRENQREKRRRTDGGANREESEPEPPMGRWIAEEEGRVIEPAPGQSHLRDLNLLQLGGPVRKDLLLHDKEIASIRERYLGHRAEKKKVQKPSEKFRNVWNFEWADSEDTAKGDINPLYNQRVEPQLLFGRGFRAGIDIREQRKHNCFYDDLVKVRARLEGDEPLKEAKEIKDTVETHWTSKRREDMDERDWRIFREDFEISAKGLRLPPPARNWEESGLPDELLRAVAKANYTAPTPIQMQSIPVALDMRDIVGIAETGSGKTAAFVLPMLTYIKSLPVLTDETAQDGPYGLILAPSRELAIQIEAEVQKFASFCLCRTVAVIGGRDVKEQAYHLRKGCEAIVGTPGRIRESLELRYTVLSQCNYVVLDEADRMIDLGFEGAVNWILDQIPTTNLKSHDETTLYAEELSAKAGYRRFRVTQMFSATMLPAVEALAKKYLRSPTWISIGDPGAGKRDIEQLVEFVAEPKKKHKLEEIMADAVPPVMVFVNQRKTADTLAKNLQKMNFSAAALHSGKAQDTRESTLAAFKDGDISILLATDVAGRGIDVEGIQLVVNYDMPRDIETYTHRIGRTGRAGRKGTAYSFLTDLDIPLFYDLRVFLKKTGNQVPLELAQHAASKIRHVAGQVNADGNEEAAPAALPSMPLFI